MHIALVSRQASLWAGLPAKTDGKLVCASCVLGGSVRACWAPPLPTASISSRPSIHNTCEGAAVGGGMSEALRPLIERERERTRERASENERERERELFIEDEAEHLVTLADLRSDRGREPQTRGSMISHQLDTTHVCCTCFSHGVHVLYTRILARHQPPRTREGMPDRA